MVAADPQVRIEMLERALHWANLTIQKKDAEIQLLQERLRKQRIGFLGPSSETLSDLQLELLAEQEPGATREEVEAESRREPISTTPPPRERKPHPGRQPLAERLPRVEEVIVCEPNCKHCGGETMERRVARRFSIFNWGADATVQRSSSKIGMGFYKLTATRRTIRWAGRD